MGTGGRNVKKDADVGEGASQASIIEMAKLDFQKNRPIKLETLVSTDRFINIQVPTTLATAFGISSPAELETQIKALGVTDAIKRYVPAKKAGTVETKDEGRATFGDVDSIPLSSGDLIGTPYKILLHTPIKYGLNKDKNRKWYTLRVPQVMGIAAFSLFLARFATAAKMPQGFTTVTEARLYKPKNATTGLTKVDKAT